MNFKEYKSSHDACHTSILAWLTSEGYIGEPTEYWHKTGDCPQIQIRNGRAPTSQRECEIAILEALVLQGGIPAWNGDGVSCAAQMVWAQHRRAERAEAEVERLRASLQEISSTITRTR